MEAARRQEPADQREDNLNNVLDRAIERVESEIENLENIAGALDGNSGARSVGKDPSNKPPRPGHTLWKAKHLEDLMNTLGQLISRIHGNIAG